MGSLMQIPYFRGIPIVNLLNIKEELFPFNRVCRTFTESFSRKVSIIISISVHWFSTISEFLYRQPTLRIRIIQFLIRWIMSERKNCHDANDVLDHWVVKHWNFDWKLSMCMKMHIIISWCSFEFKSLSLYQSCVCCVRKCDNRIEKKWNIKGNRHISRYFSFTNIASIRISTYHKQPIKLTIRYNTIRYDVNPATNVVQKTMLKLR